MALSKDIGRYVMEAAIAGGLTGIIYYFALGADINTAFTVNAGIGAVVTFVACSSASYIADKY